MAAELGVWRGSGAQPEAGGLGRERQLVQRGCGGEHKQTSGTGEQHNRATAAGEGGRKGNSQLLAGRGRLSAVTGCHGRGY